jgi:ectoine hydroxylase-related dioxygenase (phytanoyl-CoA dioxygenase family)
MINLRSLMNQEQLEAYWRDGFVLLESVLNERMLSLLRASLEGLLARAQAGELGGDIQIEPRARHNSVRYIANCMRYDEEWWDLVKLSSVLQAVRALIGEEILLHQLTVFMKPPLEGSAKEWHQDLPGGFLEPDETQRVMTLGPALRAVDVPLISVQYYLDDSTESNGCLQFVPGSHHWGMVDGKTSQSRFSPEQVVHVMAKAGSAVIFHGLALHHSAPNRSALARRAPVVRYYAPTTLYRMKEYPDNVGFGMRLGSGTPIKQPV